MAGNEFGNSPAENEIEVSLFGPGYGESILLHLGLGDWLIVDSCLDKAKAPVPLDYLRSIGLDPSDVVKLVVATHWHDDHVGGLGTVFRRCNAARFVCSDALKGEEFLTLVRAMKHRSMMTSPGVKELNEILEVLEERCDTKSGVATPTWAIAERILWTRPAGAKSQFPAQVISLSPSDASVTLAQREIAALLPKTGESKRRVTPRPPNHNAVVLWIKVGNVSVLLGSDLENTNEPKTGWMAILDSTFRPQDRASVFKVAHHGSSTAYQPRIWGEMLITEPVATLTPFIRGRITLPTKADATRICTHTAHSYSTANTKPREIKGRSNIVTKTIRETVRSIREVPASSGVIRLRKAALEPADASWRVELFGTALPLHNLYA